MEAKDIRPRPQNFMMMGDGQFATQHVYKFEKGMHIETAMQKGFFNMFYDNLMAGDMIRCIELKEDRVIAKADFMVIEKTKGVPREIIVMPDKGTYMNAVYTYPEKKKLETEKPEEDRDEFIKGSGEVKWNPGVRRHQVILDGEVVAESKDKSEAAAMARGDIPLSKVTNAK